METTEKDFVIRHRVTEQEFPVKAVNRAEALTQHVRQVQDKLKEAKSEVSTEVLTIYFKQLEIREASQHTYESGYDALVRTMMEDLDTLKNLASSKPMEGL